MQKIEEAVGALDVLEDVTNVGAAREKRVHGCNEFALIRKDTLASFGVDAAARSARADSRDITAPLAIAFKNAQEVHLVSAPRANMIAFLRSVTHKHLRARRLVRTKRSRAIRL